MEQKEKRNKEAEIDLEDLKGKLELCQKQRDEYLAGWQRARADFLNYKKEEIERIEKLIKYANEELILGILPILDNFEIAEKKMPKDLGNNDYLKGLLQIKAQIQSFLKGQGVEEIRPLKEKFDPNLQEAVEEVEKQDLESGTVIEEVKKGYKLHGKVLRPAEVKVVK